MPCLEKNVIVATLAILWALSCTQLAMAQSEPKWELGIGVGLIDFPDYRGADERQTLALPLPYINYRGERFRVGRQGVRGLLLDTRQVKLDLSLNATPPVNSHDNAARTGMQDLDPTFEFGPSLRIALTRHEPWHLELRLPLRASLATDFTHAHYAGWVFQPHLAWDYRGRNGWAPSLVGGVIFGDRRQHQYFYGVPDRAVTPTRPRYDAPGGYAGAYALFSLRQRVGKWWMAGFVRADTLRGAVFDDSPLFRSHSALYAGVAFAWIFAQSKDRVDIQED